MHRIFLPLYHFFKAHKALMYVLMIASAVVFAIFGFKLRFEEDIIKLLPHSATSNEMAFTDMSLKDKVFLQLTSANPEDPVEPIRLGECMEEYCSLILERDSSTHFINNLLCTLEADMALSAMDYALTYLPTFVDPEWYPYIEEALSRERIDSVMAVNYEMVMEDETGELSQMVAMDPLSLRDILLPGIMGEDSAMGGFAIEDGHLFCPDKTVALAFLSPSFGYTNSGVATKFNNLLRKAAKDYCQENPDVRILIHGNPQASFSNANTIKHDLVWTVGLSLLVILVMMILSFHSFRFVWQQVVPVVYGALFSLACIYWIKGYVSLMALGFGAIILGVAISYCLHILIHFYYVGSVETMLREESTPVFLFMLTTIGAFMGLLFTESDLLRDFGLFATFSLVGSTLYALIFLPHFMSADQIHFKKVKGFPLVDKINNLPWDSNKWIIGTLILVIIVGVALSPRVKFDSDLRNLDYDDPALSESESLYNEKNADGYSHQYFAAYADNLDDALEYNKGMFRTLDSLKEAGVAKSWSTVTGLLFRSTKDQEERIAAWNAFWTKGKVAKLKRDLRESGVQHGLPADMFDTFTSLLEADYEPGNLFESGIIPPGLMSNYIERQASGRYMVFTDVAYPEPVRDVVWGTLAKCPNVIVLEPFFYCRDMVEIVHDDFNTTVWISSLFVLIVLLISFRNLWIALIAFFPMFISWFVMQGFMSIFGLEFNLINIVIATFIYGIGVDYSIFVMEGLLKEARTGQRDMLEFHKVAIFYSAAVLVIVVTSLIFATHPSIHSIGVITLIGMASTILITYSLQPWAFRLLCKVPALRRRFKIPDKEQ